MSPPNPPLPPPPPKAAAATASRARAYRAEAEAAEQPLLRSVWLYEAATLLEEREDSQVAEVLQTHLAAFKAHPPFSPPLDALVRITERRRAFQNLYRVLAAGAHATTDPLLAASLHLDAAAIAEDMLQLPREATEHLMHASERLGERLGLPALPLYLELHARSQQEPTLLIEALRLRTREAPAALSVLLRLEEALVAMETGGAPEGLLEALRTASEAPSPEVRREAARLGWTAARRSGHVGLRIESLLHMAREAREPGGALALGLYGETTPRLLAAAWSAWGADDQEAALEQLARVQAQLPDASWVAALRAGLMAEQGAPLEAASELAQRAVDTAPGRRVAWLARCLHWFQEGGARDRLLQALETIASEPGHAPSADGILLETRAREGEPAPRIALLRRLAEEAPPGPEAARAWWRLARTAEALEGHEETVRRAMDEALRAQTPPEPDLLRDAVQIAEAIGDAEHAATLRTRLSEREALSERERAALMAEVTFRGGDAPPTGATEDEAACRWALPWAWAHTHASDSPPWERLATLHTQLARDTESEEVAAAHHLAAARAWLSVGHEERAEEAARSGLERAPGHPYAVALLEALLQRQGRADDLAELLKEQGGAKGREALVTAAATALHAGSPIRALELLREAADDEPRRGAPWWALPSTTVERRNSEAWPPALEGLATSDGTDVEAAHAELGALLAWGEAPALEEALRTWMEIASPEGRAVAAWHLLLHPESRCGDASQAIALEALEASHPALASWKQLHALWATLRGEAPPSPEDFAAEAPSEEEATKGRFHAALGRWIATSLEPAGSTPDSEAWARLAQETADPESRAALLVQAARSRLASEDDGAPEEAFMLALEAAEERPDALGAWALLDEVTGLRDDPGIRLQALEARLARASGTSRRRLASARGRALLAAGRIDEALAVLRATVQEHREDLGAWEALRQAAWKGGNWPVALEAAEYLAERVEGRFRAALLEEAAAVRMDRLNDLAGAERNLRKALQADPSRRLAFERLHDILAAREQTEPLLELVRHRLSHEEDPERAGRLRYEEARLLRAMGRREEALEALEQLLEREPDNPGAIALGVEILTSLQRWEDVVSWLRRLAEADAPADQRRLARLGAADFLHRKLGRAQEALEELREAERLGAPDARLQVRIARVARDANRWEEAADALEAAAALSEGARAAELWREAAELREERLGDAPGARQRWWRALDANPLALDLAEQFAHRLEEGEDRRQLADTVERAARERLRADPRDPEALRLLERAAEWHGDRDLRWRCLHALVILEEASEVERSREERLRPSPPSLPWTALDAERLATLRPSGGEDFPWNVLALASSALARAFDRSPEAMGVGRAERLRGEHPWRKHLDGMAAALLLPEAAEIYVGGPSGRGIRIAIDRKERHCWVVGRDTNHPPDAAARFQAGAEAWGRMAGATGLLDLDAEGAAARLAALWSACERPLEEAPPTPRRDVERLREVLGRRGTRALAEALPTAMDFATLHRFADVVLHASRRAALLYAGSLAPAGHDPHAWSWWTSHPFGLLRNELGWSQ